MSCVAGEENRPKISIETSFSIKERPAGEGNELFASAAFSYVGLG